MASKARLRIRWLLLVGVVIGLAIPGVAQADEDNQPPKILSLSVDPTEVDITSSPQKVTITAHITDDLAGATFGTVQFRSPGGGDNASGHLFLKSGTAQDGTFEAQITFPQFVEPGNWRLSEIVLGDPLGNVAQLDADQLEELGLQRTVHVSGGAEDNQPPKILSLSVDPTEVDITSSPQKVTITAHITDDLAGATFGTVQFRSPGGGDNASGHLFLKSGTAQDGTFEAQITFPQFVEPGNWRLSEIVLGDPLGNVAQLDADQLEELGLQRTVHVFIGVPAEDIIPPGVHEVSVEPSKVDVSGSEQVVTVIARFTDDISGVKDGTAVFASPSNKQAGIAAFERISGDSSDGTYKASVPIKRFSESGTWKLRISPRDFAGNTNEVLPKQLEEAGQPSSVEVEGKEDIIPPGVHEVSVEPSKVDVSGSEQVVTVIARFTDDISGVKDGTAVFASPSNKQAGIAAFERISGDSSDGTYKASVPIKRFSESGTWKLRISPRDFAGNTNEVLPKQLEEAGQPSSVEVEGKEDIIPPGVHEVSVEPSKVDVSGSEQVVTVIARFTDDISGVKDGTAVFASPSNKQAGIAAFERISGDSSDGTYKASVPIKRFSESGTWKLRISPRDFAGNTNEVLPKQLEEAGQPSSVEVEVSEEEPAKDIQNPWLKGISIDPTEINTSDMKQLVTVSLQVADDVSGLKQARVFLRSPGGGQSVSGSVIEVTPGNTDGVYEMPITFPRYSESGPWRIETVRLNDHAAHEAVIETGALEEAEFPHTVQVSGKEDVEAPHIHGLSIEPPEVNVTVFNRTVTLNAHILDNLSGFESGHIVFTSPSGIQTTGSSEFKRVSGDAQNGGYEILVPFKQGSESGPWLISEIRLTDATGNERIVEPQEMEERGLSRRVIVESGGGGVDIQAPQIFQLQIVPSEVNTELSSQTVTLFGYITDDDSGFSSGSILFKSPSGSQSTEGFEFKRVAGTANAGTYEIPVTFPQFSESGEWTIAAIVLADQVGNKRELSPSQIKELALPSAVLVQGVSDTDPPHLKDLSISPPEIDTSSSGKTVLVDVTVTDDISGFKSGEALFYAPGGKHLIESTGANLLSGNSTEGTYRFEVLFPEGSEAGVWNLIKVRLRDNTGNEVGISDTQLKEAELPHTVVVQSGGGEVEDTEAPRIDELSINPGSVNTSSSDQAVTLHAHITDNLSGFDHGSVFFRSPSGGQEVSSFNFKRVGGSDTSGDYEIPVTFKQFSEEGLWKIEVIRLTDATGNEAVLEPGQINELGFPHQVFVEGKAADTAPPHIDELSIEPSSIDTTTSSQTVQLTAHLTDDLSGIKSLSVFFRSPGGSQSVAGSAFKPTAGSEFNGLYEIPVTFKQFSEAGAWTISVIRISDRAGNESVLEPGQIEELGLPHEVFVEGESDIDPPAFQEGSIQPNSVNTTNSSQTVVLTGYITDNLSGFDHGRVFFRSPSGEQQAASSTFNRIDGTATAGLYEIPVTFKQFSEAGAWTISDIRVTDATGNEALLESGQIKEAGIQDTVFVESSADADAPHIDELSFEPGTVNTSSSSQAVIVNAHITDDLSGFYKGDIEFRSPSGKSQTLASFERIAGDANSGTYRAKVPFEQFSEAGTWSAFAIVVDSAFNQLQLTAGDLEELGLPPSVSVNNEKDMDPPHLKDLSIEPSEIDTWTGDQSVFVDVTVNDDKSGFAGGALVLGSPNGGSLEIEKVKLVSGGEAEGTYRFEVPFPWGSELGTWDILKLRLFDHAGNEVSISGDEIEKAELPHTILVKGGGGETPDHELPVLADFSLTPTSVNASSEEQPVKVVAHVTDDLSGVFSLQAEVRSPDQKQQIRAALKLVSGTNTDGIFEGVLMIPQFADPGVWGIASVDYVDNANNQGGVPRELLAKAGFPDSIQVQGEAVAPAVTEIAPGSGPEAGGTNVQITGSGFSGATAVRFGSKPAASFTLKSPSLITATSPAGFGTVDVTVTTEGGTSEKSPADQFSYLPEVLLSSSPNPSAHGQQVALTAKVVPIAEAAPTPDGTITFVNGSATLKVVNLNNKGSATFKTAALAAGEHKLSAVYSGDATFGQTGSNAVSQTVNKAVTELALTSSLNPAPYGSVATLKATVEAVAPGAGTPAGTVTFREGEAVLGTDQLSGKNATFSLKTLSPGVRQITATYSGDPNNESSKALLAQTIDQASTTTALTSSRNPAPYGSSTTLKATVDAIAPTVDTPDGTVTFYEGPEILATVPLSGTGVGQYSLKTTPPGTYEITVTYNGNANYKGSESSLSQVITKASTELSLTSSLNPAPYGSSASLKATVDTVSPGGGTPDGSVTFRAGETVLTTVPLSSSGIAKYALKTTPPGSYEITASYNGDANYASSEGTIGQTVTKASTELILTSSKNPAPKGASGNIKATVKAISPGTGTPPGTVTFSEGTTTLAVVPLSGNAATLPIKSLTVGTHEITATYSGSGNYEASESVISQVITP